VARLGSRHTLITRPQPVYKLILIDGPYHLLRVNDHLDFVRHRFIVLKDESDTGLSHRRNQYPSSRGNGRLGIELIAASSPQAKGRI
jgi:hypothetical protein